MIRKPVHKHTRTKQKKKKRERETTATIVWNPKNRWTLSNYFRQSEKLKLVVRKAKKEPELNPRSSGRCRNW